MTSDAAPPAAAPSPPIPSYPVRLEVVRPQGQSRITNFPLFIGSFIRAILAIPHLIVLYFLQIVASLLYFVATFVILFTGAYPQGMYNFNLGFNRWSNRVSGYLFHLYDTYPPFTFDPVEYPLAFEAVNAPQRSRLLNFPVLGPVVKYIFCIPHFIVLIALAIVAWVLVFVAQFAILFTGAFPEGMHTFVTGVFRWSARVQSYIGGLTDEYPPFSLR